MAFHGRKRRSSQRCVAYLRVLPPLDCGEMSEGVGDAAAAGGGLDAAASQIARIIREARRHNGMSAGFRADVLGDVVYAVGAPTGAGCSRMIRQTACAAASILTTGGFFLSGAITVGTYTDADGLPSGEALVEAQAAEAEQGMVPRVVLSETVVALAPHDGVFGDLMLTTYVRRDGDDKPFVHYAAWTALPDVAPRLVHDWLSLHQRHIETRLRGRKTGRPEHVGSLWLARYHNRCCRDVLGADELDGYLVEPSVSV